MMRFMRKLHKWLGLMVGIQLGLWLLSGLVMSLLDEGVVSGAVTAAFEHDDELLPADATIMEPATLLQQHSIETAHEVELRRYLGRWVWRVQIESQASLYDAFTGARIEIAEAEARQIAGDGYAGKGSIVSAQLLTEPTLEARGHGLPLWRVAFDDERNTRYYISVDEGRILERRNDTWRLFDFFWMLHTMDYVGRDNFNTPWVIVIAFLSVWLAVSGTVLLVTSFSRRRARPHQP